MTQSTPHEYVPAASLIETHTIDYIPADERFGKASDLGAIWFVSGVNLTGIATGVAVLSIGASLFWTLVATVLGSVFGTFFMAAHSAQGPQLGLPQLVQSRPQFGFVGSAFSVWIFALVNYIAYNTSDALLSGAAAEQVFGINPTIGYLAAAVIAAVLALFGYRWIHAVNKLLALPLIVLLVAMTYAAVSTAGMDASQFTPGPFEFAPFMTVFVIVAGFQLGWAPYVSDYSRYLPAGVGLRSTFWWTYLPSALTAVWVFALGAIVSAAAPGSPDPVAAFKTVGDTMFVGFGNIVVVVLLVGLLAVMAINQYGGSLAIISIISSVRPVSPTLRLRAASIIAMAIVVFGISQWVGVDDFNTFYANALIFLAYLFTPWTAINLVDYFWVRRGEYIISEIFNPDGIYGRWGWRGTTSYLFTLVCMVPFMVTAPFAGFLAARWGGVDYSLFVGLPVAALAYWTLCRSLDLDEERALMRDVPPTASRPRAHALRS
jgi:purine-cytosine permease-like protein